VGKRSRIGGCFISEIELRDLSFIMFFQFHTFKIKIFMSDLSQINRNILQRFFVEEDEE